MIRTGERFAGYELEARLGESVIGVLYKACDVRLQRPVALRIVPEQFSGDSTMRARLNREATILASIIHPNVAPILEAGTYEDSIFIATQWVDGIDLSTLTRDDGPLDPRRAVRIVDQIASALQAAHARAVIHRDVKPPNVLVTPTGHAYLTNFALARRSADMTGLTVQDHLLGQFDYTAPEYIRGAEADARVDIYGLGCVLYQALTGELPYPRSGSPAKMYAHLSAEPPSPRGHRPEVPDALDAVVRRALSKEPADRQQTAPEFAIDAAAALGLSAPAWTNTRRPAASESLQRDGASAVAAETEAPFSERHDYRSTTRRVSPRALLWTLGVMLFLAAPLALLIALHRL